MAFDASIIGNPIFIAIEEFVAPVYLKKYSTFQALMAK
jgi:hypothetical protein